MCLLQGAMQQVSQGKFHALSQPLDRHMQIPPQFICQLNKIFSNLKVWSTCHCPATKKAALEGQLRSWHITVEHFLNTPDGQQLLTGRRSKEDILLALLQCHWQILKVLKQQHNIELFVVSWFLSLFARHG